MAEDDTAQAFGEALADVADDVTQEDAAEDVVEGTQEGGVEGDAADDAGEDVGDDVEGDEGGADPDVSDAVASDDDDPYAGLLEDDAAPENKPDAPDFEAQTQRERALTDEVSTLKQQLAQMQGIPSVDPELRDPDSEKYDPEEYNRQVIARERREGELQKVQQETQDAQIAEIKQFMHARDSELKVSMPHLFDPNRGPKIIDKMREVALESGISPEQFNMLPAKVVGLLDEALRYRAGTANLKKATETKPVSSIVRKSQRKGPNKANTAADKLKKTGSADAFGELLISGD